MSSPDEPGMTPTNPEAGPPEVVVPVPPPAPRRRPDTEVIAWAKAVVQGIGDTARDMLESGREGAAAAEERGWARFRAKTRYRRKPPA